MSKREPRQYPRACSRCGLNKDRDEFYVKYAATETRNEYRHPHCIACYNEAASAAKKRRLAQDGERIRARSRAKYAAHPERERQYRSTPSAVAWRRMYTEQNRERLREQKQRRRALNRHGHNEWNRRWAAAHPDSLRRKYERDYKANKDRFVAHTQLRRARLRAVGGRWTRTEWAALKKRYGNRCLKCGKPEPEIALSPDHVVPLAGGGSNHISNIQPLCRRCNAEKGATVADYRAAHQEAIGPSECERLRTGRVFCLFVARSG